MNVLETKIHRLIEADGPISVALYMALCLGDAEHGYYMKQDAFGTKGDFITAPEVSQLFGEIVGVHLALRLDALGGDQAVTLVELGPGRGTLMADVLRTLKKLRPKPFALLRVAMVETSERLRAQQARAVLPFKNPVFHDTIASLPADTPLLIFGNEFLDAIPMHQYVKSGTVWHERLVKVERNSLVFTLGTSVFSSHELPAGASDQPDGTVFEIAPARNAIIEELSHRLSMQGGSALFMDYGHLSSGFGDTFQAMRAHSFAPVLESPGEVDLTSHVDFEPLKKVADMAGCVATMTTQGEFLLEHGLLQRAGALGFGKTGDIQSEIQRAVERLAAPGAMGDLFKVLSFWHKGSALATAD